MTSPCIICHQAPGNPANPGSIGGLRGLLCDPCAFWCDGNLDAVSDVTR